MIDLPKGLWRWLSENARDLARIAAALEKIALEVAEIRRVMQKDEQKKDGLMPNKVHGNTIKGAKLAFERGQITEQSHAAVLAGEMTLQEARNIGTEDAPTDTPEGTAVQDGGQDGGQEAPRSASADASPDGADKAQKFCLCGCGEPVRGKKSRFRPGHDARLHSDLKRNLEKDPLLRNERFTEEQRAYARERGLLDG